MVFLKGLEYGSTAIGSRRNGITHFSSTRSRSQRARIKKGRKKKCGDSISSSDGVSAQSVLQSEDRFGRRSSHLSNNRITGGPLASSSMNMPQWRDYCSNVFRELGRINRGTGRALFANSTAGEILNRIDQLLCIRDELPEVVLELKHALAQLKLINNARNLILHNGWRHDDQGKRISSNLRRALDPQKLKQHSATAAIFDDMRADLSTIQAHLFLYLQRLNAESTAKDNLRERATQPWRYIPPQPASSS